MWPLNCLLVFFNNLLHLFNLHQCFDISWWQALMWISFFHWICLLLSIETHVLQFHEILYHFFDHFIHLTFSDLPFWYTCYLFFRLSSLILKVIFPICLFGLIFVSNNFWPLIFKDGTSTSGLKALHWWMVAVNWEYNCKSAGRAISLRKLGYGWL